MKRNLKSFERRCRLAEYFNNNSNVDLPSSLPDPFKKFRHPKSWTPQCGRNPVLDTYILSINKLIKESTPKRIFDNITREERQALYHLQQRTDVIIKPADKGGAVVSMKVCDYIEEGMRQLMDTNTYKPLETDPTEDLNKEMKNMVAKYRSLNLIDDTADILVHPKPRPGRFYMLPKIHKMNNPGRPIISGNDTATERLSLFVDLHLQPIVQQLPSFVKDTSHFLQIIEKLNQTYKFDDDTLLATFDVTSLYTNIPHDDGLMALSEALNKRTVKKPSTNVLTNFARVILKSNNFTFNGKHYLQIQGTSMGTRMAPSYANIFMGKLEDYILASSNIKPLVWLRYIDDMFIMWNAGSRTLEQFTAFINNPFKKFRHPKSWTPQCGRNPVLDTYILSINKLIKESTPKRIFDNITREERQALYHLQQRTDVIIKPADKGGAVVAMKVCDYIEEGMRQLMDTNTYKPLETDPTEDLNKEMKNMVAKYRTLNLIDDTADILVHPKPRPGRFYMLPKIHKMNNPGRPIISGNDTATERLSLFVDLHLQPIVQQLPSFVKDTSHFLQIIEKLNQTYKFDDDTLLATFDVTSLYTNIQHDDGLMALSEALNKRTVKKPSTNVLTNFARVILKSNNFTFNGIHYLQIQGTSMGTRMAPSYANIFMGKLEDYILASFNIKPLVWLRYIDDIFIMWNAGSRTLEQFTAFINSIHPTIKFTGSNTTQKSHLPFLDVLLTIHEQKIITDLYHKPTDIHLYLNWTSCHPRHTKLSIIYSQALRI
ncbi:hypothetical protein NDU88_001529 [Pleurodeles waltl]|uniref:Reverse transcriptase domain-containing protein n=1 Tax=Pleurodeles waltl TaxID=8319 RepID=A0AAV7LBK4_PLEWA|nr:hypothetical protein NDU88_001529 [Pleurodeles waltl]